MTKRYKIRTVLTLKYFIASSGECSVSVTSSKGSSDLETANCRDLEEEKKMTLDEMRKEERRLNEKRGDEVR